MIPMEVKVCMIGDSDVGKSPLIARWCYGPCPAAATDEDKVPQIGASFLQRRVMVDSVEISLQIWDTEGQERFRSMAPMYYRGAKAAICVFDVTNEESFTRISTWVRDLRAHADPDVVICLAGNRCHNTPTFDLRQCETLAKSIGGTFHRTSEVTGEGLEEMFATLSRRVVEAYGARSGGMPIAPAPALSPSHRPSTFSSMINLLFRSSGAGPAAKKTTGVVRHSTSSVSKCKHGENNAQRSTGCNRITSNCSNRSSNNENTTYGYNMHPNGSEMFGSFGASNSHVSGADGELKTSGWERPESVGCKRYSTDSENAIVVPYGTLAVSTPSGRSNAAAMASTSSSSPFGGKTFTY